MGQALEITRFFRFLNRCGKRMKKTLQLSKKYSEGQEGPKEKDAKK